MLRLADYFNLLFWSNANKNIQSLSRPVASGYRLKINLGKVLALHYGPYLNDIN